MTTVQLSNPSSSVPRPTPVHRALQCVAGFYANERVAREVLGHLRVHHGLTPQQTTLLSPQDKSSLRMVWYARRWAGRWPFNGGSYSGNIALAALFVAVALLGLAGLWLTLDYVVRAEGLLQGLILPWLLVCAAIVAAAALLLMQARLPRPQQFDASVRRQLAIGNWAVVAHGIHPVRQTEVVAVLQHGSTAWSAEALPLQPL